MADKWLFTNNLQTVGRSHISTYASESSHLPFQPHGGQMGRKAISGRHLMSCQVLLLPSAFCSGLYGNWPTTAAVDRYDPAVTRGPAVDETAAPWLDDGCSGHCVPVVGRQGGSPWQCTDTITALGIVRPLPRGAPRCGDSCLCRVWSGTRRAGRATKCGD